MEICMEELRVEANVENLPKVLAFVDDQLEMAECPMKAKIQIDIAVEEIFVNIAHYAYAPGTGDALIRVRISDEPAMEATPPSEEFMQKLKGIMEEYGLHVTIH